MGLLRCMLRAAFATGLLIQSTALALNVDCKTIQVDKISWDFSKLNKDHVLRYYEYEEGSPYVANYTFGFNLCQPLPKKETGCTAGTRVCGSKTLKIKDSKEPPTEPEYFEITGSYPTGESMDAIYKQIKEGVRVEAYGKKARKHVRDMIRIDFICTQKQDKERKRRDDDTGEDDDPDIYKDKPELKKEGTTDDDAGGSISVVSWGGERADPIRDKEIDRMLSLKWETPYACRDVPDDAGQDRSPSGGGGWGFFSWFFFLSFMGLIAYFCFFAWINYSRFGKSGIDMLPHADTLRELPQLLTEYARKIVNTLRGGHSGGGYSAL